MPCFPTLIECRLRDKHIEASPSDNKADQVTVLHQ